MDAVLFITLIFAILYLTIALILLAFPQPKARKVKARVRVAVLIAMRNEQEYIADCLTSLSRQDYDPAFFDVFILDDRSADRSPEIARKFTRRFSNFHLISVKNDLPGLKGKMNVLAQGLKLIDHELVLITDADCAAPKTWISRMVSYFSPGVGMVGALTVLYPFDEIAVSDPQKNLFAKVQALDWIFLQTLASANSNAGKPITILGNNFAFRKKTYEQVGGFEAIGFSVTEDFALMEAVRKKTSWKIIHTLDPENSIYSHPSPDLRS
ncbi:MAG: glycosyltransferase, partial [Calditrichaeota bacterium]|nr:glycosyltransferase [Calditrichota bacterium]